MTQSMVFWLYMVNSILLIVHEIDSGYQKEWELFKMKGGATGFLLLHFPLLLIVLWGLIQVWEQSQTWFYHSLFLCLAGIGCYIIHTIFIKKGHPEFTSLISLWIIRFTGFLSLFQLVLTIIGISM